MPFLPSLPTQSPRNLPKVTLARLVPTGLVLAGLVLAGLVLAGLVLAACGDDAPVDPTGAGGTGGSSTTSNMGGFDPVGVGGFGGSGAGMNEGGTGTLTYGWDKQYGGDANVFVKGVAVDGAGNIVVAGSFSGTANLGGTALVSAGADDVFVAKYDSNGNHVWSQRYGNSATDSALSVAVDSGGAVWITGQFRNAINLGGNNLNATDNQFPDAFIAKYDAGGNHQYSAAFGIGAGYTDVGNALAVDSSDNVVMAGVFQTSISFGGSVLSAAGGDGDRDMFVAKFDSNGGHIFSQRFGGMGIDEALGLAVAANGVIALVGYSQGDLDFGAGTLTHGGSGDRATLAVLDPSGNHVYSRLFQGAGESRLVSVAFSSGGDAVAAGTFKTDIVVEGTTVEAQGGNDDLIALRYDGTGNLVYQQKLGSNGAEKVGGVAVDGDGYAIMTGWFKDDLFINSQTTLSENATNNDAFLIRLGPPGNPYAAEQMNAMENAQGRNVTLDGDGDVIVVGDFSGELDFGGGPVGSGLSADMFIARFSP